MLLFLLKDDGPSEGADRPLVRSMLIARCLRSSVLHSNKGKGKERKIIHDGNMQRVGGSLKRSTINDS